ncbi:MFS transporter [Candidatus Saccharibacteria bacterium]|nr:MFS transporter [Candidatus Saccharibacteria bacterium]
MKRLKAAIIVAAVAIAVSLGAAITPSAFADPIPTYKGTVPNSIVKKALLEDMYFAYDSNVFKSSIALKDLEAADSVISTNKSYNLPVPFTGFYNISNKKMLTGIDKYGDNGEGKFPGIFSVFGKDAISVSTSSATTNSKIAYLNNIGYEVVQNESDDAQAGGLCFKLYYHYWVRWILTKDIIEEGDTWSNYLCADYTAIPTGDGGTIQEEDYYNAKIAGDPHIVATASPDSAELPDTKPIAFLIDAADNNINFDCETMKGSYFLGSIAARFIPGYNIAYGFAEMMDLFMGNTTTPFDFLGSGCDESIHYTIGETTFLDLITDSAQLLADYNGHERMITKGFAKEVEYSYGTGNHVDGTESGNPFARLVDATTEDALNSVYNLKTDAKQMALNNLLGTVFTYNNETSGSKFTKKEKVILYDRYIKEIFGLNAKWQPEDAPSDLTGYTETRLIDDATGDLVRVYIQPERSSVSGLAKVRDDYHFSPTETVTFSEVAAYLLAETSVTNIPPDELAQYASVVEDPTISGDVGSDGSHEPSCYDNAGSLGWVVCPIIDGVADFIIDKYERWVEPALQINTKLFGGEGSETYEVWNVFRNIANIAFAIVFLIIIFSQLTGVGIDNYGIKKILPKLIIGAILINLSYIICQLAIDLANILGYGVAGIFKGIASEIQIPETLTIDGVSASTQPNGWDAGGGLTLVVIGIVAAISALAVLSQGTAIIIPILMAVVGVAISLFTLIAILAMRQAAAVLLVVASPLAFVAYMLPNTKKLFDKWFTVFKGLLIAFPACSALIYGGDLVGRILVTTSSGSTWITLSAAIVSIAPIFFIPKLIKSSMGAVSTIASNLTGRASKGIGSAIGGSQWAKNVRGAHEARKQFRNTMRQSGYRFDREGKPTGRSIRGRIQDSLWHTKAGSALIARNRAAASREGVEIANASRFMGATGLQHMQNIATANREKMEAQDVQDEISTMLNERDAETGEYKYRTLDDQQNAFEALMTGGVKNEDEAMRLKALATKLSASGAGQKFMGQVLRNKNVNQGSRNLLAQFATSSASDLISKISAKDAYAAQYLEDASIHNDLQNYADWQGQTYHNKKGTPDSEKLTNSDFVTTKQLDKQNLFAQGGDALEEALNATDRNGNFYVSAQRIGDMLSNPNVDIDYDKRGKMAKRIENEKNDAIKINHEAEAAAPAQQQAAPAQQQAAPAPTQNTQQAPRMAPRSQQAEEVKRQTQIMNNEGSSPAQRAAAETWLRNNGHIK